MKTILKDQNGQKEIIISPESEAARDALLKTGNRTLTHRTKRDSKTIPGAIMAEIYMGIRGRLKNS